MVNELIRTSVLQITVMGESTQCSETGPWFENRPMKNILIGNKVHEEGLILEPDWIIIGGFKLLYYLRDGAMV